MGDTTTTSEPPPNKTVICLLGELQIDQEKVSVGVVSDREKKETLVQLDKPAPLGNALTVGTWLNDSWGTKVEALVVKTPDASTKKVGSQSDVKQADVEAHLKKLGFPDQVVTPLSQLFCATIVITDLHVHLWTETFNNKPADRKAFKFGIAVNLANVQNAKGLNLFGDIYLTNVKLGILNAPSDYDFDKHKLVIPPFRLLDYAEAKKEVDEEKEKAKPKE